MTTYEITHTVEDGIERIVYTPHQRRFATPILLQHGMWHGAWCWRPWQELLASWGWESHAYSLPGHGQSPMQRPIRWCTLNYYFEFLMTEVQRLPRRPVLMGHSMGGALAQWYLKYVGDDLPAAVLVAPWPSHTMRPSLWRLTWVDPFTTLLCWLTLTTTPSIRTADLAAKWFLTEGAIISPQEFHAQLGPESALVLLQYQPPFWTPVQSTQTRMLWLAGDRDLGIAEPEIRSSAAYYGADYVVVRGAGHDLMLECSYCETVETIHAWLCEKEIP